MFHWAEFIFQIQKFIYINNEKGHIQNSVCAWMGVTKLISIKTVQREGLSY